MTALTPERLAEIEMLGGDPAFDQDVQDISIEYRRAIRDLLAELRREPDYVADVAAFHKAGDVPIRETAGFPDNARVQLRVELIEEEASELRSAALSGDLVGVADGLADLIYVAVGAALEFGIPLDKVWAEVHRSNMAKVDQKTGKIRRRADGKILKPADWSPPQILPIISRAMQRPPAELSD